LKSKSSTEVETGFRQIAYISRAKGLKGEVVLQAVDDLSLHLLKDRDLWVVPPSLEGPRSIRLVELKEQVKESVARFSGVVDATTAKQLAGRYLLAQVQTGEPSAVQITHPNPGACSERCTERAPVDSADDALIGLRVVDALGVAGEIGTIREIRRSSAQELWVVDGGEYGEVLIPAVDEFINTIDQVCAQVTLPTGLLELNH
jgi:16S rRNA processing protein RimM